MTVNDSEIYKVPETLDREELVNRIHRAMYFVETGCFDGAHHKMWTIDQIARALTGCPVEPKTMENGGRSYSYESQGESPEYETWVAAFCDGEYGPDTYEWDVGVPP